MPIRHFIWDTFSDSVLQEADGAGVTQVTYTHEPGAYGPLVCQMRGALFSYYHFDALGSTRILTDDSQDLTDTYLYDGWGNEIEATGVTRASYRWAGCWGYQFDALTGRYYVRARAFQPNIARWMSTDPLWPILTLNPFMYSSDRPVQVSDPSGMISASHTGTAQIQRQYKMDGWLISLRAVRALTDESILGLRAMVCPSDSKRDPLSRVGPATLVADVQYLGWNKNCA